MNLFDFVQRSQPPKPWEEGDNIPWNEPGFSQRMLREHLSQEHDAASRRFAIIDRQVAWINQHVLGGKPARILDLGCGPGLYLSRLARLGHTCVGIDFSPASTQYARESASQEELPITYIEGDIRKTDYGTGFDLAMSIYGEFNVFRPADARLILSKAWQALKPGGHILVEAHTFEAVQYIGEKPGRWYTAKSGLFSDKPHLLLEEGYWDAASQAATRRHNLVDAALCHLISYAASYQAYSLEGYHSLFESQGFKDIRFLPSLLGIEDDSSRDFLVILAGKAVQDAA